MTLIDGINSFPILNKSFGLKLRFAGACGIGSCDPSNFREGEARRDPSENL